MRVALLARQLLFSGTVTAPGQSGDDDFRAIHARFARYVIGIYAAAAAVAIAALLAALISDLQYQRRAARQSVELETQLRAQYLGRHLALLAEEVHRLGDRPEIDLLDQEFGPEERLLLDSHDNSTIFNRGVALLDGRGPALWAAPSDFLEDNPHPVPEPLLAAMTTGDEVQILPSGTGSPQESVLCVRLAPVRSQSRAHRRAPRRDRPGRRPSRGHRLRPPHRRRRPARDAGRAPALSTVRTSGRAHQRDSCRSRPATTRS